jgi:hypothetical protein
VLGVALLIAGGLLHWRKPARFKQLVRVLALCALPLAVSAILGINWP